MPHRISAFGLLVQTRPSSSLVTVRSFGARWRLRNAFTTMLTGVAITVVLVGGVVVVAPAADLRTLSASTEPAADASSDSTVANVRGLLPEAEWTADDSRNGTWPDAAH